MPRVKRRQKLIFVERPSVTYMKVTDIPFVISSPEISINTSVRHIVNAVHNIAALRKSGERFTLAIEVPGAPKDVKWMQYYLNITGGRKAPARLVKGCVFVIDDNRLAGRLTFKTR